MIQIYCDTREELKCLKEAIIHSEDCPFDYKDSPKIPCPHDVGCCSCISDTIFWYVKKKGSEN